jgi:hypothetical protein
VGERVQLHRSEEFGQIGRRAGHRTPMAVGGGDLHVLPHRQRQEGFRRLEGAVDAEARQTVHRCGADRSALEHHAAAVRRIQAGDDVDAGRLARTIGTDKAEHLAWRQLEADAIQCAEAAEAFHQLVDAQQRARARGHERPSL